jgi:hypothetical protein
MHHEIDGEIDSLDIRERIAPVMVDGSEVWPRVGLRVGDLQRSVFDEEADPLVTVFCLPDGSGCGERSDGFRHLLDGRVLGETLDRATRFPRQQ